MFKIYIYLNKVLNCWEKFFILVFYSNFIFKGRYLESEIVFFFKSGNLVVILI